MDLKSLTYLKAENPIYSSKDQLLDPFITLVTSHLADRRIPNPDQKDSFLLKLIIMLQYKDVIEKLELHQTANEKLLPSLLLAFEGKSGLLAARSFLRLLKGRLYDELPAVVLPVYGSARYRSQFVNYCLKNGNVRDKFLNDLFSHINDLLSSLNLKYAERHDGSLSDRELGENLKSSRGSYETLHDMLHVLETVVFLVPLLFLESSRVLKQRASNLCMLIIREVVEGHVGKLLLEIPAHEVKRIETGKALVSPVAGIYMALSKTAFMERTGKFVSLQEFMVSADGFDISLMKRFVELLKGKAIKGLSKEFFAIRDAVNLLDSYIARHPLTVCLANECRTKARRWRRSCCVRFAL